MDPLETIRRATLVFWDFDGVIKESIDVKTRAFEAMFAPYGDRVRERVKAHHELHGGMTRSEKIPLYLRFAGEPAPKARVAELCAEFGRRVRDAVIESPWVPGAEEYLRANRYNQHFVVVSATPQPEIEHIVSAIDLDGFEAVFGAPVAKADAISEMLRRTKVPAGQAVMIGDSSSDVEAARANGVLCVLRAHDTNGAVISRHTGPVVKDFSNL